MISLYPGSHPLSHTKLYSSWTEISAKCFLNFQTFGAQNTPRWRTNPPDPAGFVMFVKKVRPAPPQMLTDSNVYFLFSDVPAIHSRIVRLHRPFLSRGYEEDSRFAYSTKACVESAKIVVSSHQCVDRCSSCLKTC